MKTSLIITIIALASMLGGCATTSTRGPTMNTKQNETALFAGGCFWCMESAFEATPGVTQAISGYTGGHTEHPTYEQVGTGTTGHYEAVLVHYDPTKISYAKLLETYWLQIDPTDPGGQFTDRGPEYKTAIFYKNEDERRLAERSKENIATYYDEPIVTEILPRTTFYPAEEEHQDYYKKQQLHYQAYAELSGRKGFVKTNEEMIDFAEDRKEELTPLQYRVTQENGTESPFKNEYWNNTAEGIYVDIVSGEPLFSSLDKYKSGTGWPSFTKPLEPGNIITKTDNTLGVTRVEVRSKYANSHLGHVFDDGPEPTGERYCMNSAALRFIPKEDLQTEGYGDYRHLFDDDQYQGTLLAGTTTPYLAFNKEDFEQAQKENKTILLYFYANWCPTCKAEQEELIAAANELDNPNAIIFRVNYRDSETDKDEEALAKTYGITIQHTKIFLEDGKQSLKAPNSWDKQDYLDHLGDDA